MSMPGELVAGFDDDLLSAKELGRHKKLLTPDVLRQGLRAARLAARANSATGLAMHGKLSSADCLAIGVLTRDESPSVRAAAARALASAADPEDAIPGLLRCARDPNEDVRKDAIAAVASYGDKARPALLDCLRMDPEEAEQALVPLLVAVGASVEEPLAAAMHDTDERIRANAVAGLIGLGHATLERHREALVGLGQDPSKAVRSLARAALGTLYRRDHPQHAETTDAPSADFTEGSLTPAAAKKLVKGTPEETLLHFTRDGRDIPRRNAWLVLSLRGKPDPYLTALAAVATKDPDGRVRALAAAVLSQAHDDHLERAVRALVQLTGDDDPAIADAAGEAIDTLGQRALKQLLTNMDVREGDQAALHVAAICRFGQPGGKAVGKLLDHPGPVVRTLARQAIGRIGGKALVAEAQALVDGLIDTWDPARESAARCLGEFLPDGVKDPEVAIDRLTTMHKEDPHSGVRNACEKALRKIATRVHS